MEHLPTNPKPPSSNPIRTQIQTDQAIQTLTGNLSKKTNLSIKDSILKKDLLIRTTKDSHKDLSIIETENLSTETKESLSIEMIENLLTEVTENHSKKMTENPLIVIKENPLIEIKENHSIEIKKDLITGMEIMKENHTIHKNLQIKSLTSQDKTKTSNIKKNK